VRFYEAAGKKRENDAAACKNPAESERDAEFGGPRKLIEESVVPKLKIESPLRKRKVG